MSERRLYFRHIRAAHQCMSGARVWFKARGWSWASFVAEGRPVADFVATGCPLALRAVEKANEEYDG